MANRKKYDWDEIHSEFTRSNVSLRDIAKKHGMSYAYLAKRSSKENWFQQRERVQSEAREVVAAEITKQVCPRLASCPELEASVYLLCVRSWLFAKKTKKGNELRTIQSFQTLSRILSTKITRKKLRLSMPSICDIRDAR